LKRARETAINEKREVERELEKALADLEHTSTDLKTSKLSGEEVG